jgi:hypothetical protein
VFRNTNMNRGNGTKKSKTPQQRGACLNIVLDPTQVFDPPILHLSPPPYMLHVTYFRSSWNTHIPTLVVS